MAAASCCTLAASRATVTALPSPLPPSVLPSIPVIDLGALFLDSPSPSHVRAELCRQVVHACETWGFFQVVNHGIPLEVMEKLLAKSQWFFTLPYEEKARAKQKPEPGAPLIAGFFDDDLHRAQIMPRERFAFFFGDGLSKYNIWHADMREIVEEYAGFAKELCALVLEMLAEGLGIPPNDLLATSDDTLHMIHYPPSSKGEIGVQEHTDGNTLTLLLQDDVGGLEVLKDGQWHPVPPIKGAVIMNVADTLQVWSNLKYKSVSHRAKNHPNKHRYSIPYFSSPPPNVMVKPLSQCTTDIGEAPKYRAFEFREYMLHRLNNMKITSPDVDEIHLSHYAI